MGETQNKIISSAVLVGVALVTLLGGLALLLHSLRKISLTLYLDLNKNESGDKATR